MVLGATMFKFGLLAMLNEGKEPVTVTLLLPGETVV
jgi:hypothetical protein